MGLGAPARRRGSAAAAAALALLLAAPWCAWASPEAGPTRGTAYIGSGAGGAAGAGSSSLLAALRDPSVSRIVVEGNYTVDHEFDRFVGSGVPVDRNLTITGAAGLDSVLDLQFVYSAVELCGACTLTFRNVTVANERRGTGGAVDFVLGQPGSRVVFDGAYRLRPACTKAHDSGAVANATKRSVFFPNPKGPQLYEIVDVRFQGRDFPASLHLVDHSVDDPPRVQEGRGRMGGTAVRTFNSTRLCTHTVDPSCLQRKSSDACVNDLVDSVLSMEAGQRGDSGSGGGSGGGAVAGIAAGAAAAGLLAVGAVLGLLWARQRRRRQRAAAPAVLAKRSSAMSRSFRGGSTADSSHPDPAPRSNSGPGLPHAAGSGSAGWQLSSCLSASSQPGAALDQNKVVFGELLGAGSFGRVFRAHWAGQEVAVKVIDHDSTTAEDVENEVALMMAFCHRNVVRALHCVTFLKTCAPGPAASTATKGGGIAVSTVVAAAAGAGGAEGRQRAPTDSASSCGVRQQLGRGQPDAPLPGAGPPPPLLPPPLPPPPPVAAVIDVAPGGSSEGSAGRSAPPSAHTCWSRLSSDNSSGFLPTGDSLSPGGSRAACRAETWLVQEYCDLGTFGSVVSQWTPGDESDGGMLLRLLMLRDVAQGLQVLHSRNVVHGDLNARNVLVSSDASSECGMVAKLADLGLSRVIKQHKTHRTTQSVGTMSHMPPELLRYGRMSPAVDVYAYGVMMWEVFTGQAAFRKLHYGQFFEAIVLRNLRPLVPPGMPADYQLLMEHCWSTDAANRPKIERVLECLGHMIAERRQSVVAWPA